MEEGKLLDKKSLRFLKGKNTDWDELAKDCISFANAHGGSNCMKNTAVIILTLLILVSCNGQVKQNDCVEETKSKYQDINEYSISFGEHNSILDCKPTDDNNYLLFIYAASIENFPPKRDFYILKINSAGDTINSLPINFENFYTNYIEFDEFYYVVDTDRRTMGGYTKDFLNKCDKNWKLIWSKKYPHFYPQQTILTNNGNFVFYGSNDSPDDEQEIHHHYLKIIALDKDGNLKWQKDIKQNYDEKAGNVLETKDGNFLFSSTITPIKNKGRIAYIFELNTNGNLTFERKFEYPVGINSVPYIIRAKGQITMIGQKWIGKFGEPFKDVIQITKLTE